ncbi:MAG: hypothetical protein UV01_C0003G0066 [Parcubacteria group bacterium GW2011_GWA2_42_14]|nr:MAG: hypothetical protein UV01_C0003G0066 [Parcubacteria group bacterium GW2011_GWA2_42_14]
MPIPHNQNPNRSFKYLMKRIYLFKQKITLDHYVAEAYTVRCVDDRFWKTFKNFLREQNITHVDPKSPAGGVKVFASPNRESDREYNLDELAISIKLHHVKKVMLFSHSDCGAYGGLKKFNGNKDKELRFHLKEHEKAKEVVGKRFPGLKIETYFIDEEGVIKTS